VDCIGLPEITYGDFARALIASQGRRIPFFGSMEVTFRCNLHCAHCYIPGKGKNTEELNTGELCLLIDEFAKEGLLWLHITGGEPLLREDFKDIYLHAKHKGIIPVLFTNGTLITPELADMFAEFPPISTEITIYGASRRTYERVTGVPGSFDRCIQGIDLLRERGLKLKLKTMLMTLNENELYDMQAFAERRGLKFRYDPNINASLTGSKNPCSLRLSPDKILEIESRDPERLEGYKEFTEKFWGPPGPYLFPCGAGLNSFHMDPFGNLSLCILARFKSYNLKEGTFKEAWHEFIPSIRELRKSRHTRCDSCEIAPLCVNCPGWAFLENGDPEEPVEFLCTLAHLQREVFGLDGIKEVPDETAVSKA
jgi:radical SAM protein with 4Fe4S-binding SPASM domain